MFPDRVGHQGRFDELPQLVDLLDLLETEGDM
jgi:hypothetical protein